MKDKFLTISAVLLLVTIVVEIVAASRNIYVYDTGAIVLELCLLSSYLSNKSKK